jgi:cyclopropane-fatty-acyl-phospholipid synthase
MANLLASADIRINGDRPWDIHVHDRRFFSRVLASGTLGLGNPTWTAGGTAMR